MCRVTIAEGIDAGKLSQAIYETVYAGIVAEAEGRRKAHEERLRLIRAGKLDPIQAGWSGPAQASLFDGDEGGAE